MVLVVELYKNWDNRIINEIFPMEISAYKPLKYLAER